jgi:hypothetical protein
LPPKDTRAQWAVDRRERARSERQKVHAELFGPRFKARMLELVAEPRFKERVHGLMAEWRQELEPQAEQSPLEAKRAAELVAELGPAAALLFEDGPGPDELPPGRNDAELAEWQCVIATGEEHRKRADAMRPRAWRYRRYVAAQKAAGEPALSYGEWLISQGLEPTD